MRSAQAASAKSAGATGSLLTSARNCPPRMWKPSDLTDLIREGCCGSCTRFGRPLTKARQGLVSYKLLLVFEVKVPASGGPLFAEFAKTLPAHGRICLSVCLIASRSGDLHHHGQPVLDSRKLASLTSWLGKRFSFLFAAQCRRRPCPQQTKLCIPPVRT